MSFSLSGAIDLAADIIAHAPADGRIAKTAARLPSIQKEGGGRHGHSTNPVATKYQGTTKDGDSITLELSDDKATIDHVDFGNPLFVCDNPFWSIFPGDNSTKTKVQIWQSGGFFGAGGGSFSYGGGGTAGLYVLTVAGAFGGSATTHGVTAQSVAGTLSLLEVAAVGPAEGTACAYGTAFTASAVATSG